MATTTERTIAMQHANTELGCTIGGIFLPSAWTSELITEDLRRETPAESAHPIIALATARTHDEEYTR